MPFKPIIRSSLIVATAFLLHGFGLLNRSKLTVKITDIQNKNGVIEIGLYNDKDDFPTPNKQYKKVRRKILSNKLVYTFEDLPHGKYALAIYHDENKDNECNRNFFGVPTEAYAFSRNFRPWLSAPEFSDCSVYLDKDKTITIKLVY
jgi:uncharacterized protein (DUF2141 family)